MKQQIQTDQAPSAIGPYSQAVRTGDILYTSGQIALDPATGELVEGGIEAQTKRVMENLKGVLASTGCDFSHVLKVTIYVTDMNDFQAVNKIYGGYLREPYPARSTVEVAGLPKGALVEMDAVARVPIKMM